MSWTNILCSSHSFHISSMFHSMQCPDLRLSFHRPGFLVWRLTCHCSASRMSEYEVLNSQWLLAISCSCWRCKKEDDAKWQVTLRLITINNAMIIAPMRSNKAMSVPATVVPTVISVLLCGLSTEYLYVYVICKFINYIPYSLKFVRDKFCSETKFADKIFMVKLPAMHCIMNLKKIFAAML